MTGGAFVDVSLDVFAHIFPGPKFEFETSFGRREMTTRGVGVMSLFEEMGTKGERGDYTSDVFVKVDECFSGGSAFKLTVAEIPVGFESGWIREGVFFEILDGLIEFRAGTLVCDESSERVVFERNSSESDTDRCRGDFGSV